MWSKMKWLWVYWLPLINWFPCQNPFLFPFFWMKQSPFCVMNNIFRNKRQIQQMRFFHLFPFQMWNDKEWFARFGWKRNFINCFEIQYAFFWTNPTTLTFANPFNPSFKIPFCCIAKNYPKYIKFWMNWWIENNPYFLLMMQIIFCHLSMMNMDNFQHASSTRMRIAPILVGWVR